MKKIVLLATGLCLFAQAQGQGYWSSMIDGAPGDFPNLVATFNSLIYHDGTLYEAGNLSETTSAGNNNVYAFNGTGYMLGTNATGLNSSGLLWTLCADGLNNIYAAGAVDKNAPGFDVMKWDGNNWAELGGTASLSANGFIYSLCSDAANNIYAAGNFKNGVGANAKYYVAKWNGSTWSELGGTGALGAGGAIQSIAVNAAGNLYAGGYFTNASGKYYVAQWNGSAWSELGGANALAANDNIEKVYVDAAGNVYAAGRFTNAGGQRYVAKWNGTTWSELGTGTNALNANNIIKAITGDAAGNIYAAGLFTSTAGAFYVAKWNGTTWSELGAGTYALNANAAILALCTDAQNRIYAAGNFSNDIYGRYVARYASNIDVDRVRVNVLNNLPPEITVNGGNLQMEAKVYPVMSNQNVTWSIAPGALATISATGMITALGNGEVWAKATSVGNPAISDSMKVTISGQSTASIASISKAAAFKVFPNPAAKELFVEVAPEYRTGVFTIYDVKGNVVLRQKMNGSKNRLPVQSLSQGIYTLQLASGAYRLTTTFTRSE